MRFQEATANPKAIIMIGRRWLLALLLLGVLLGAQARPAQVPPARPDAPSNLATTMEMTDQTDDDEAEHERLLALPLEEESLPYEDHDDDLGDRVDSLRGELENPEVDEEESDTEEQSDPKADDTGANRRAPMIPGGELGLEPKEPVTRPTIKPQPTEGTTTTEGTATTKGAATKASARQLLKFLPNGKERPLWLQRLKKPKRKSDRLFEGDLKISEETILNAYDLGLDDNNTKTRRDGISDASRYLQEKQANKQNKEEGGGSRKKRGGQKKRNL